VVSFYEMYKQVLGDGINSQSPNVLDQWILARLSELKEQVTKSLDNYEIDRATRPFMDFVDDLSTWYIRRSRDRFKNEESEDAKFAAQTTKFVLKNLAKLMAPFTPFIAEDIYQKVRDENESESVHLEMWPELKKTDAKILSEMQILRDLVTRSLDERTKVGIKVRQPLSSVTIKKFDLQNKNELLDILKDELNVKKVEFNQSQEFDVVLDTNITENLKQEGSAREFIRSIQQLRKDLGLKPIDEIFVEAPQNIEAEIGVFVEEVKKSVRASEIKFSNTKDIKIKKIS
jgi:isoleucyl-tRNA synthetase